jgi:predicted nuclease of predicted toxin-antitoxin system
MRILFDHVTPRGIARFLSGHTVTKAKERGWDTLTNGDLLAEAERAGFDVLLTADKNMRYQQNLVGRRMQTVFIGLRPFLA